MQEKVGHASFKLVSTQKLLQIGYNLVEFEVIAKPTFSDIFLLHKFVLLYIKQEISFV